MPIYEIRTYTIKPGSTAEFESRFGQAVPAREKYSPLAAFWHTEAGPLNQVIHVWGYEDLQHRAQVRAKAAEDPNWPPKVQEFIVSMESEIFVPPPFSPALGGGKKLGNVYEMRIYQYQPGSIPTVIQRWEEALQGGRLNLSPIAACMSSEIGKLNVWIHIWPYANMEERNRIRAESQKLSTWPPKTREFLASQQTKILIPAAFSPTA
jgi:hypothetical protein